MVKRVRGPEDDGRPPDYAEAMLIFLYIGLLALAVIYILASMAGWRPS